MNNFNLSELEQLFYDIQDVIEYFENISNDNNVSKIYLSSGDRISINVSNSSIAHLLGINTNYLISTNLFKSKNSYDMIKEIMYDPYRIYKLRNEGYISSKHVKKKVDSIIKNSKINIFETEFICKYDSSLSYQITENNEKFDYIICRKYEDEKIGILGLVEQGNYYVPMSNQIFNNMQEAEEKIKNLITNQQIAYISLLELTKKFGSEPKKIFLPYNVKSSKIKTLKEYKYKYNCSIDVTNEVEHLINKIQTEYIFKDKSNDSILEITKFIKERKTIDEEKYRDENIINLIRAYNDLLYNQAIKKKESHDELIENYTALKEKILKLKHYVNKLETENSNLRQINNNLKSENSILTEENESLKEKHEKILQILKPRIE